MQPSTQPPRRFHGAAAMAFPEPVGIVGGEAARRAIAQGRAVPLAGGPLAFTAVLWHRRGEPADLQPVGEIHPQELDALARPRPPLAGLPLDRPRIMGVVNVTPDSFSDGGQWFDPVAAINHGRNLAAAGADIIDVGGESTRPGADPLDPEAEQARVLPVVRALAEAGLIVSIDTRNAATMRAAVATGAKIINDVAGLTGPEAVTTVASLEVPAVLMHMRGDPRTMQDNPTYDHVVLDVASALDARVAAAVAAGIDRRNLVIDPGIGFGKTAAHNLDLIRHLGLLHGLDLPILVGVSRKSFIQTVTGTAVPPIRRIPGSLAAGLAAVARGAQLLRVHDVAETRQALAVQQAVTMGFEG
ncbi:MAG: dihydropteroate synthase [Alphaproteobacteria bacterium]|nr:MAG: dihydropteroate synthase [Alphaproteobacteria bacterium]